MAPGIPDDSRPVARPLQTPSQRVKEHLQNAKEKRIDAELRRELAAITEVLRKKKSCGDELAKRRPYFCSIWKGRIIWLMGNSSLHQTLQTEVSINWNLGHRR